MPDLADLAADAYLAGWALTEAPCTGRVHAGCVAAVATALEFRADPAVLEAALLLGHAEGVQQQVAQRRKRLLRKHLAAVAAAWDACVKDLDPRDVVRRFRRDAYLPHEAATRDPTKKWWQDTAIAAALGWLRGVYSSDGYGALVAAIEDAIRTGMAEGEAGALALAASRQGKTGFRIADAFQAAYGRLASDHSVSQRAADAVTAVIDGTARDVGRRLASLAGDDGSEEDMAAQAGDLASGDGSPARSWSGDGIWAAIGAGALALWSRLAGSPGTAVLVSWDAQPGACPLCEQNASNSPYAPQDVPTFPGHRNCRCSLSSDSRVPSPILNAFLSGGN